MPLNELFAALAKAQGQIKGALKDNTNPFFKGKYADLASMWEACRIPLSQNGLSVIQTTRALDSETVTVYTTLGHPSGQRITGGLTMKPVKADPQGIGSTITYARRYALAAMVGVAPPLVRARHRILYISSGVQKYLHDKAEWHSACCYYYALEDLDEQNDDQARNEEEPVLRSWPQGRQGYSAQHSGCPGLNVTHLFLSCS